jgi:hypothetical protein
MRCRRLVPRLPRIEGTRFVALALLGLGSCEHQGQVVSPSVPVAARPAPAPEKPPNTPLPLPDEWVMAGRWRAPQRWLEQLASWGGGMLPLEHWLRTRIAAPNHPVDLSLPIEFLVLWDHQAQPPVLRWAASLALDASAPAAAATGPIDVHSGLGLACAEASALGPAPLRVVCASSDEELALLLPLATRALPLVPLAASDIALLLHAAPLRRVEDALIQGRVSSWLGAEPDTKLSKRFDAEFAGVRAALTAELRNLAEDLDGASLELSLAAESREIELSLLAPAAQGRSELARSMAGSGALGVAPTEFWDAEQASDGAGYLWAFEPEPLASWRAPLGALLAALLDFRGLPVRLQQQGRRLIERLPLPRGPVIHAAGQLPAPAAGRPAPPQWLAELGWQMVGASGSLAEYEVWVDELVSATNDPILGPQLGRLLRSAWGPNWALKHAQRRRPLGNRALPRGSFTLELTLAPPRLEVEADASAPGAGRRESSPATLFVLFVPEPGGLRVAWGADEALLVSLGASAASGKASGTLAGRPGLGSLHGHRSLAGGFSSWMALRALAPFRSEPEQGRALVAAPHRGRSPIVYRLSPLGDSSGLSLRASLGRDSLEDLFFLMAAGAPVP